MPMIDKRDGKRVLPDPNRAAGIFLTSVLAFVSVFLAVGIFILSFRLGLFDAIRDG
jgi:hypothetical protein